MATTFTTSISSPAIAHQPLALINARLIDPEHATETKGGILIADGCILDLGPQIDAQSLPTHAQIIDCEHRETIASATAAAAAGGITTILMRPDTTPPVDEAAVVDFLLRRARDTGRVRVIPAAALTKGLSGQ
jgi:dihydroorotase